MLGKFDEIRKVATHFSRVKHNGCRGAYRSDRSEQTLRQVRGSRMHFEDMLSNSPHRTDDEKIT